MFSRVLGLILLASIWCCAGWGQLTDQTQAPNTAKVGIAKSLPDEVGAGRGDANSWNSSIFIIQRDPFRVSIDMRLHADQLRIHVIRAGFGKGGQGIRRDARPA